MPPLASSSSNDVSSGGGVSGAYHSTREEGRTNHVSMNMPPLAPLSSKHDRTRDKLFQNSRDEERPVGGVAHITQDDTDFSDMSRVPLRRRFLAPTRIQRQDDVHQKTTYEQVPLKRPPYFPQQTSPHKRHSQQNVSTVGPKNTIPQKPLLARYDNALPRLVAGGSQSEPMLFTPPTEPVQPTVGKSSSVSNPTTPFSHASVPKPIASHSSVSTTTLSNPVIISAPTLKTGVANASAQILPSTKTVLSKPDAPFSATNTIVSKTDITSASTPKTEVNKSNMAKPVFIKVIASRPDGISPLISNPIDVIDIAEEVMPSVSNSVDIKPEISPETVLHNVVPKQEALKPNMSNSLKNSKPSTISKPVIAMPIELTPSHPSSSSSETKESGDVVTSDSSNNSNQDGTETTEEPIHSALQIKTPLDDSTIMPVQSESEATTNTDVIDTTRLPIIDLQIDVKQPIDVPSTVHRAKRANVTRSKATDASKSNGRAQQRTTQLYPDTLRPLDNPKDALQQCFQQMDHTDWEMTMQGLTTLVRLTRHHPTLLHGPNLHTAVVAVVKQVRNLRSQIARAACQVSGELLTAFKRALDPDLEEIVGALLHRSADTNKFLRADSNAALDVMLESCSPAKIVQTIVIKGASHKNATVRAVAARLLVSLTTRLGPDRVLASPREIRDKILLTGANMLTEGSLETRSYAKELFRSLSTQPNFYAALSEAVPAQTLRNIKKTLLTLK